MSLPYLTLSPTPHTRVVSPESQASSRHFSNLASWNLQLFQISKAKPWYHSELSSGQILFSYSGIPVGEKSMKQISTLHCTGGVNDPILCGIKPKLGLNFGPLAGSIRPLRWIKCTEYKPYDHPTTKRRLNASESGTNNNVLRTWSLLLHSSIATAWLTHSFRVSSFFSYICILDHGPSILLMTIEHWKDWDSFNVRMSRLQKGTDHQNVGPLVRVVM